MSKKNLIITILGFAMIFTSNASAQPKNRKRQANKQPTIVEVSNLKTKNAGLVKTTETSTQYATTMMEGSNIRKKQSRKPSNARVTLPIGTTQSSVSANTLNNRKPTTRTNRRKFDHIGNIQVEPTVIKQEADKNEFANTMMEGANIKRKQPRKAPKTESSPSTVNPAQPFFRPNPAGDGTTEQIYGEVHPGQAGMEGTNMVKRQTTPNPSSRRRASVKNQKKIGFMDYTDDAAMTQIQSGQNSGGASSKPILQSVKSAARPTIRLRKRKP